MAELFFEDVKSAIGQTLTFENSKALKITMIFEIASKNTTEKSNFYLSFDSLFADSPWMSDWKNLGTYTFVQLTEGSDIKQLEQKLKPFLNDYNLGGLAIQLQPYGDSYLYSDLESGGGKIEYVHFGLTQN